MSTVIIEGSHRKKGNTNTIVDAIGEKLPANIISLIDKKIGHYEYDHSNTDDDFIPLMQEVIKYDTIILASPIYWYNISGRLKVFIDRLTDCMQTHKSIGRALAGKTLAAISCGSDSTEYPNFFLPFALTAEYLDMTYLGHEYTWINIPGEVPSAVNDRIEIFCKKVNGQ